MQKPTSILNKADVAAASSSTLIVALIVAILVYPGGIWHLLAEEEMVYGFLPPRRLAG